MTIEILEQYQLTHTKLKIMEIWKDIEGYPNYQVSNMGRVKSLKYDEEKILKSSKNSRGYLQVGLCKEGKIKFFRVHRLVAQAFLPNPNNLSQVNHRNEDKTDNRVENLEWCNRSYNTNYGTRNERIAKANSIPILQFSKSGELVKKWDCSMDIERELGFYHSNICMCCNGKRKSVGSYKWHYHYKSLWLKNHIPQIKLKKAV